MALFSTLRRDTPREPDIRRTDADDPVLAQWGMLVDDPAAEYWILDGRDGKPVAMAWLRPVAGQQGTVQAWILVDRVVRHFGLGERMWTVLEQRARKLKATTITSFATGPEGAAFLYEHGFDATHDETMPDGTVRAHGTCRLR